MTKMEGDKGRRSKEGTGSARKLPGKGKRKSLRQDITSFFRSHTVSHFEHCEQTIHDGPFTNKICTYNVFVIVFHHFKFSSSFITSSTSRNSVRARLCIPNRLGIFDKEVKGLSFPDEILRFSRMEHGHYSECIKERPSQEEKQFVQERLNRRRRPRLFMSEYTLSLYKY